MSDQSNERISEEPGAGMPGTPEAEAGEHKESNPDAPSVDGRDEVSKN